MWNGTVFVFIAAVLVVLVLVVLGWLRYSRNQHTAQSPSSRVGSSDPMRGRLVAEIRFRVRAASEDLDIYTSGYWNHVEIDDPEPDIRRMSSPDAIVLQAPEVLLVVDYPLGEAAEFPLRSASPRGFRRAELARRISEVYHEIYAIEDETSSIDVSTPEQRREAKLLNRNATDGKYAIWGHDIGDLALHFVYVYERESRLYLHLSVDS